MCIRNTWLEDLIKKPWDLVLSKIWNYATIIDCSELEYLSEIMLQLVETGTIENDASGLNLEFRDLQ